MDELRETLTRQVGPFQVWQWALIIVGGIIVGRMIARQLGPSGDAPGEPADPVTGQPFLEIPHARVGGPDASAPGSGGAAGDFRADPDAGGDLGPTTNMDWLRLASRRLGDQGTYGPAQVDTALRRYLEGQPVTPDQVEIVGAALDAVGPPPEGAPSMLTETPPPSDPPTTTPPGTGDSNDEPTAVPPPADREPTLPSGVTAYVRFGDDAVYEIRSRSIEWVPSRAEMTRRVGTDTWHRGDFVRDLGSAPRGYRRLPDRNTVWLDVLGRPRAVDRRATAEQLWGPRWNEGSVGDPNTLTKATR